MRALFQPHHAGSRGAVRSHRDHRQGSHRDRWHAGGNTPGERRALAGGGIRAPARNRGRAARVSPVFTILRKELTDTLRDRRSALFTILGSAISGPLMVLLIFNLISGQAEKAEQLKLPLLGRAHSPALVAFLEAQQVTLSEAPSDFAQKLKEGDIDVVLEIDAAFAIDTAAGKPAKLRLHYDQSRDKAGASIGKTRQLLNAYNAQWGGLRLLARGIAPEVARPLA